MKRLIALLVLVGGCASGSSSSSSEDPATTQPSYWYAQTGATVESTDFDTLWQACDDAARDFLFNIDRSDYRAGVLTTEPLTTSQWFEIWRPDYHDSDDRNESSLAAIRRSIRFEVTKRDNGFEASPKVLVEREVILEQRITSITNYRSVFPRITNRSERPKGSRESDAGVDLPSKYWYPIGRDSTLEAALVNSIQKKLRKA